MDNVVQNISMEDIVPSKFQSNNADQQKIEELAQLIKKFGIIDPIIVREKNGKYEIVLGNEKYQAAILAGLNMIPALIKEIDDETFSNYLSINNQNTMPGEQKKSLKNTKIKTNDLAIPLEPYNMSSQKWINKELNENSDIVNLAELSKIKLEYERDDLKMNNEQMNNMMMNNNLGPVQPTMNQPVQGPTFGGRFFPSLEDEPTNMNMMGNVAPQAPTPGIPNMNNNLEMNNNLIDLTDLSMDKEPTMTPAPDLTQPTMVQQTPEINPTPMSNIEIPQPSFGMQPQELTMQTPPTPSMDSVISLESLQSNNPAVQPIAEPNPIANLNSDFGAPSLSTMQQPQFDMSQNIAPTMNQTIPDFSQPMNDFQMPQKDFSMNGPTMESQPAMSGMGPIMAQTPEIATMATLNEDFGAPNSMNQPINTPAPTFVNVKDIAPVTNTIKNLVSSLEAFGYIININEEELPTSTKLTIEIEK